jgi:hypothetical protein
LPSFKAEHTSDEKNWNSSKPIEAYAGEIFLWILDIITYHPLWQCFRRYLKEA